MAGSGWKALESLSDQKIKGSVWQHLCVWKTLNQYISVIFLFFYSVSFKNIFSKKNSFKKLCKNVFMSILN